MFGEGPSGARLMLVGEQPGDQEDLAGEPFVGPAGQLLRDAFPKPVSSGREARQQYVKDLKAIARQLNRGT